MDQYAFRIAAECLRGTLGIVAAVAMPPSDSIYTIRERHRHSPGAKTPARTLCEPNSMTQHRLEGF